MGQRGTPEYGQGNNFKDFISYELTKATSSGNIERAAYYNNVLNTSLQRQIGSRYFVTAYNSARIIFLLPAAIEFLNHLNVAKTMNKLEQYIFSKLKDTVMICNVRIDGLFFYHVYSDLSTLVKSNKLNK